MKPSATRSQWQPTISIDQSIYEANTTQQAPLGTRLEVGDRVFYYAQAENTYVGGTVLCAPVMSASLQADILVPAAASSGSQAVTITMGEAVTVNAFAEGYMSVSSGTAGNENVGYMYRIKSNAAVASAGNLVLNLYDPIEKAITAAAEINLTPNIYKGVNVGSAVLGTPVGVAPCDVTSAGYFWLQTYGPCAPLHVGATTVAAALQLGTVGAVKNAFLGGTSSQSADVTKIIGFNFNLAATNGENTPVMLTIRA
jgi:hypothetical protein